MLGLSRRSQLASSIPTIPELQTAALATLETCRPSLHPDRHEGRKFKSTLSFLDPTLTGRQTGTLVFYSTTRSTRKTTNSTGRSRLGRSYCRAYLARTSTTSTRRWLGTADELLGSVRTSSSIDVPVRRATLAPRLCGTVVPRYTRQLLGEVLFRPTSCSTAARQAARQTYQLLDELDTIRQTCELLDSYSTTARRATRDTNELLDRYSTGRQTPPRRSTALKNKRTTLNEQETTGRITWT